ncbi:MAG: glycosyltransferase [Oscillospiraceae bacterium]|jgi:glycosyltransferase involved in cell wall biosynthesis/predicted transcriptional regulator|nr:glycosyltransferase [Oscillospiraceae bacterium]MBQ2139760.1 glycosyltransferase [Acidaminococcaceae bacterium]MEE3468191.1 glycosyltransferase [Eubacterium sp.]MBQ1792362.1 glycosyltransferase [Oscillospiraceae bacterium]MBQ3467496.1 glycosyltransferase [Oscillospiraceae bacterium]
MNKVSIIIPVYNGEKRLKRCVDSILMQDYPDFELILVDDGSRDSSLQIMEDYARQDARVKAIHKANGGASSARNRGLAEAVGSYIQFVDVDDWLPMESTKLLVREMEAHPVELVVGDFYRVVGENVSQKGSIEKSGILSRQDFADEMLRSPADLYYGVLWNKLYKREIIEKQALRMDESISYSEDMIFNLEYLLHVDAVAVTKAPVYYYHYTKGSLVDQNLNLSSTIKMKTGVIGYYARFYKGTFDTQGYQERLPVIYSYLLAFSRDSLSLPFVPGTKRLGTEAGEPVYYDRRLDGSPFQSAYLNARCRKRLLDTLAKKHELEPGELSILYTMKKLDAPCSVEMLASFTGLSRMSVVVFLAKLLAAGLITRDSALDVPAEGYCYHAPMLSADLEQMERDYAAICFAGFSAEELSSYRRLDEKMDRNILSHLTKQEL